MNSIKVLLGMLGGDFCCVEKLVEAHQRVPWSMVIFCLADIIQHLNTFN